VDSNDGKSVEEFVVATVNKFDVLMQTMHHLCNCTAAVSIPIAFSNVVFHRLTRVKFNDLQQSIAKTHQAI
jgi:hypothetical protein